MGSLFLTFINIGLAVYSAVIFFKCLCQFGLPRHPGRFTLYLVGLCSASYFGLPRHPGRFTLYLVGLCSASYFCLLALADLTLVAPVDFVKWRALPLVAGGLGLLMQVITVVGQFSVIQQKVISRIPLIAALLFFAFFAEKADFFLGASVLASVLFLTVSVGKARYQKRALFKMSFFLILMMVCFSFQTFSLYIVGKLFLFPATFYLSVFEQSFGVSTLVDEELTRLPGVPT